jgi:DNA (cytosine-5)-methyltransferase 1
LSYCLDRNYWKGTNTLLKNRRQLIQVNNPTHSNDRIYHEDGLSPTLNSMQGGRRQPFVLTEVRSEESKKIRREHKAKTGKDFSPRRGKEIVQKKDGLVGTLTTSPTIEQTIVDGAKVRRLTPLECFRLQGAPDSLYEKGKELGIADTNLYKMIGNSVTVPLIKAIAERLHVENYQP